MNIKRRIQAALLTLIIAAGIVAVPFTATAADTAGTWQKDGTVWYFVKPDGTNATGEWVSWNEAWYWLKADGKMAENEWLTWDGARYYLGPGGAMASAQWVRLSGAWYYFRASGAMVTDQWLQEGDTWYWLKSDGKMAEGEKLTIRGTQYEFTSSGAWVPTLSWEEQFAAEVLRLTNAERERYGLRPLSGNNTLLTQAAVIRATETITLFDHIRPDGRPIATAYTDLGGKYKDYYIGLGENLAYGFTTPESVVQGWMDSPGHRANILDGHFTQMGSGVVKNSSGRIYWTQLFYG